MAKYDSTIPAHASDGGDALLREVIRERLGGAGIVPVVTAVTGLLGRVAFADRRFESAERERIRRELLALAEFGDEDVDVICDVLSTHIDSIGIGPTAGFCDVLCQFLDEQVRTTMLAMLIELAVADGHIFGTEVGLLERVAGELQLDAALASGMIDQARKSLPPAP